MSAALASEGARLPFVVYEGALALAQTRVHAATGAMSAMFGLVSGTTLARSRPGEADELPDLPQVDPHELASSAIALGAVIEDQAKAAADAVAPKAPGVGLAMKDMAREEPKPAPKLGPKPFKPQVGP